MKVEVSIGEAIDKLNILELKCKKITDENKIIEIKKEIDALSECLIHKETNTFYYNLLTYVNESIWDMTNDIKNKTIDDSEFAIISNNIFEYNQKRFRIKNWFNLLESSDIKEQKSYASTNCKIIIENKQTIFEKIAEIHYLALEYDAILFETPYMDIVKKIFTIPTFIYDSNTIASLCIDLDTYTIPESVDREIFELSPIKYLIGGLFGDFIQALSVVNEKFYQTGRKGIIYISNKGDAFRNGLENTYTDTYSIIKHQVYVNDYIIFDNHHYDIDLTSWRHDIIERVESNPSINWIDIYKKYDIEWGNHKWLTVANNNKWSNSILINTTHHRWPTDIDFSLLYQTYKDQLLFIGSHKEQYDFFVQTTSLNIPYIHCDTFFELSTAIHSCKLFIGSLSGPLAIAHACHKDRIIGLCTSPLIDRQLNTQLYKIWNNISYYVSL
jgi:hypothetical protein